MNHKYRNYGKMKPIAGVNEVKAGRKEYFNFKVTNIFIIMMLLMTIAWQSLCNGVEAKQPYHGKKTLKLLQKSSSLVQFRSKRDTFAKDEYPLPYRQQHQLNESPFVRDNTKYYENIEVKDDDDEYSDYYDDNYDVIPNMFDGSQPPTLGDQISATAKQVAESFSNMWQSLTESIHHCVEGLRALFGGDDDDGFDGYGAGEKDLTPEEQQQLRVAIEQQQQEYRAKYERDNEVVMNIYEHK